MTVSVNSRIWAVEAVDDYRTACLSRQISLAGRREVVAGRAKFGIFGDGKEVAQVALARQMRPGDWRAGYYRDQTLALAAGIVTPRALFAQLYGDADIGREPASGGRQMNNHFATRLLDSNGEWRSQLDSVNSAAGFGAVAVHMASALGLAYASKLYRNEPGMRLHGGAFSRNGDEVVFVSIGNGSAAEGIFLETMNAAAVLQVPMVVCVWDDGYAISVPNEFQMVHGSVSAALSGMAATGNSRGLSVQTVDGWDYPSLRKTFECAVTTARGDHVPALVHVTQLTQPLGHSTSGSHERYKSPERLQWEDDHDCLRIMRNWLVREFGVSEETLDEIEGGARVGAEDARNASWADYIDGLASATTEAREALQDREGFNDAAKTSIPSRSSIQASLDRVGFAGSDALVAVADRYRHSGLTLYRSHLYSQSLRSPLAVNAVAPEYSDEPEQVDGRQILLRFFDQRMAAEPRLFVIGEDVGRLGDVNLVYEGLVDKYGPFRVTDTGIREATILGQGIGAALRGLRPIVDIQYLDYFLFALEVASDDLATLHYRTAGGQKAPVVIRTKGHRLVGMTHSGSPLAVLLHACRGVYLCVPRDMTQAAGMYATLLDGDNPGIVIEVLNGYRLKEPIPVNLSRIRVPLGVTETIRSGHDVTIVTYGAMCRICLVAADELAALGIEVEIIDVQTLNPFDRECRIAKSVAKTGAVVFADEDVPGGATAFMMREVLENQGAFHSLDSPPYTITAAENRPAYGTDGDFFTKPSASDIVATVYGLMRERSPVRYPRSSGR